MELYKIIGGEVKTIASSEKEPDFNPVEQSFNKVYRRYRINSNVKIDVEIFFELRMLLNEFFF